MASFHVCRQTLGLIFPIQDDSNLPILKTQRKQAIISGFSSFRVGWGGEGGRGRGRGRGRGERGAQYSFDIS